MKLLWVIVALLLSTQLLGDLHPGYPPNPYDPTGGQVSPVFSDANQVSIYWIDLLDAYQYGPTWLEAGGLVRDLITEPQWIAAMDSVRTPLGPVMSRKVSNFQVAPLLPYGTKGNFMIIHYETSFAKLPNVVETVILMTEGDLALWKVVSYRIHS